MHSTVFFNRFPDLFDPMVGIGMFTLEKGEYDKSQFGKYSDLPTSSSQTIAGFKPTPIQYENFYKRSGLISRMLSVI